MSWGLSERVINNIHSILKKYPSVEKAVLYGSRAKGNFKKGSDIDLVLFGSELDNSVIYKIKSDLEDSDIPYFVDIENFDNIENSKLREHIERVGAVFYEGNKSMTKQDTVTLLPANWELKKLGEIGKVSMCKRILKADTTKSGDIPFYKIGTFGSTPNAFITSEIYNKYKKHYPFPKKGDILLSASGTIGKAVEYDGKPAYFQDSNIVWLENNENKILNKYLKYFYMICDWRATKGATINRLYNDNLRNIEIPVCPLPEQKKIVSILDKCFTSIDRAIAIAEMNLKNSREIFTSYLSSIFSVGGENWEVKKLGEVCEIINGKNQNNVISDEGKYPIYGSGGNIMGYATDYICEKGTTIIGRKGNIAIPIYINERFWNVDTAFGIYPKNNYDVKFIHYLCLTIDFKSHNRGTTIPSLVKSDLLNLEIPFINILTEQKKIIAQLDALRTKTQKLEEHYSTKLNYLADLKKSILQKAFSGGLSL